MTPKGTLDIASLQAAGLVSKSRDGIRLLGDGELSAKLQLTVDGASKSAIEKVEKAGGSVTVTGAKVASTEA